MKIEFEIVKPDAGSSFRVLHQKGSQDFIWAYHYHPEIEITCVPGGTGTRHVGNHLSTYDNGELVLIGPNLPHSGFGLNASYPHEEVVLQIPEHALRADPLIFPEMKPVADLLERARFGVTFSGKTRKLVTKQIMDLACGTPFLRYVGLLGIMQQLAHSQEYELLNKQIVSSSNINKHKARLQKIFTFVEQHYNEEPDLRKVAGLVQLSIPSFCNYFKKTTHITFTEFVNRYRIQKACLLLQEDKTIAEACFETGFNNVTYFNKVFKQFMNKTPSSFRKEA